MISLRRMPHLGVVAVSLEPQLGLELVFVGILFLFLGFLSALAALEYLGESGGSHLELAYVIRKVHFQTCRCLLLVFRRTGLWRSGRYRSSFH